MKAPTSIMIQPDDGSGTENETCSDIFETKGFVYQ